MLCTHQSGFTQEIHYRYDSFIHLGLTLNCLLFIVEIEDNLLNIFFCFNVIFDDIVFSATVANIYVESEERKNGLVKLCLIFSSAKMAASIRGRGACRPVAI